MKQILENSLTRLGIALCAFWCAVCPLHAQQVPSRSIDSPTIDSVVWIEAPEGWTMTGQTRSEGDIGPSYDTEYEYYEYTSNLKIFKLRCTITRSQWKSPNLNQEDANIFLWGGTLSNGNTVSGLSEEFASTAKKPNVQRSQIESFESYGVRSYRQVLDFKPDDKGWEWYSSQGNFIVSTPRYWYDVQKYCQSRRYQYRGNYDARGAFIQQASQLIVKFQK